MVIWLRKQRFFSYTLIQEEYKDFTELQFNNALFSKTDYFISASSKVESLYLQSTIQCSLYGDTFSRVSTICCNGCYQAIKLISFFFQLFNQ